MVFIIGALINLKIAQRKAISYAYPSSMTPSLYTLEVSNLPKKFHTSQLLGELFNFFDKKKVEDSYTGEEYKFNEVADIQLADSSKVFEYVYKRDEMIKEVE